MNDRLIKTSVIADLWGNPKELQLLAYLLSRADKDGNVECRVISVSWNLEQSIEQICKGLRMLENMHIISKVPYDVFKSKYHINALDTTTETPTALLPDVYQTFAETFNRKVKDTAIPQIRGLSDTRKKALMSRAKEYGGIEVLENILDRVIASDFLSGRKTDFCASFDWIFKKANFIKIIEGNYDNKSTSNSQHAIDGRQTDRYSALAEAAGTIIRGS